MDAGIVFKLNGYESTKNDPDPDSDIDTDLSWADGGHSILAIFLSE